MSQQGPALPVLLDSLLVLCVIGSDVKYVSSIGRTVVIYLREAGCRRDAGEHCD